MVSVFILDTWNGLLRPIWVQVRIINPGNFLINVVLQSSSCRIVEIFGGVYMFTSKHQSPQSFCSFVHVHGQLCCKHCLDIIRCLTACSFTFSCAIAFVFFVPASTSSPGSTTSSPAGHMRRNCNCRTKTYPTHHLPRDWQRNSPVMSSEQVPLGVHFFDNFWASPGVWHLVGFICATRLVLWLTWWDLQEDTTTTEAESPEQ